MKLLVFIFTLLAITATAQMPPTNHVVRPLYLAVADVDRQGLVSSNSNEVCWSNFPTTLTWSNGACTASNILSWGYASRVYMRSVMFPATNQVFFPILFPRPGGTTLGLDFETSTDLLHWTPQHVVVRRLGTDLNVRFFRRPMLTLDLTLTATNPTTTNSTN